MFSACTCDVMELDYMHGCMAAASDQRLIRLVPHVHVYVMHACACVAVLHVHAAEATCSRRARLHSGRPTRGAGRPRTDNVCGQPIVSDRCDGGRKTVSFWTFFRVLPSSLNREVLARFFSTSQERNSDLDLDLF